jgi:dATP pyrophosphohydrolase
VLPTYAFAVDCSTIPLRLSAEHTGFEWIEYERAYELLRWESNRVALWELNQRLSQGLMPKPK